MPFNNKIKHFVAFFVHFTAKMSKKITKNNKNLTKKQELFIQEYLVDMNATQAYKRAGYAVKNDNVAHASAQRMLRNATVKKEIERQIDLRKRKLKVTAEDVIDELIKVGFTNITDVVNVKEGFVIAKDTDTLTENQQRAISEIKQTDNGVSIKMHNKLGALKLLGQHLGIFLERIELNNPQDNKLKSLPSEKLQQLIKILSEEEHEESS